MIVANRDELLAAGNVMGRRVTLDIIEQTMKCIDASRLTKDLVQLHGNVMTVGGQFYDLAEAGTVYVLGGGKGVLQIAEGLEQVLGDRIAGGLVVEKRLNHMARAQKRIENLRRIKVRQAGHPVPDEDCVRGAEEIVRIAEAAREGDLVFCCVQGGCSSLTTLPAAGLTLADVQTATRVLLQSGVGIATLDALRMAITQLRGGNLARIVHPAEIINLVVNDYVWRYPEGWKREAACVGWGPCVPVPDAAQARLSALVPTLSSSDIWSKLPTSVREYLEETDFSTKVQTATDLEEAGVRWHTWILAEPQDAAEAASRVAREMGLDSLILSTAVEGEAAEAGILCGAVAKEIARNGRPVSTPGVVLLAGETTVTVGDEPGEGGPNQECVLSAALKIDGSSEIVIASIGTDGTDGPTDYAGGIVDGDTLRRAREMGIDVVEQLKRHNSSSVLETLNDAIRFNEPGNNVCDLSLIVVTGGNC
jgi:glycerate-2-kinase